MAILTFPSIKPNREDWGPDANALTFVSPLSRTTQTRLFPGTRWQASIGFSGLEADEWRDLEAFVVEMGGMSGRVYYGPRHAATPRGTAGGTPLVNGASQTGSSLVTDGWTASETVLRRGDYIAYDVTGGRSLHILTADAASDGAGNATLAIKPAIRISPADNEPVITSAPTCVMMFASNVNLGSYQPGVFADYQLDLVEAFV